VKNFHYGTNITRYFPLEIIIMLSGQRQIKEALGVFGLKDGMCSFFMLLAPKAKVRELIGNFSMESLRTYEDVFSTQCGNALSEMTAAVEERTGLMIMEHDWNETKKIGDLQENDLPSEMAKLLRWNSIPRDMLLEREWDVIERTLCERILLMDA